MFRPKPSSYSCLANIGFPFLIFLLCSLVFSINALGQDSEKCKKCPVIYTYGDTIKVNAGNKVVFDDTAYISRVDREIIAATDTVRLYKRKFATAMLGMFVAGGSQQKPTSSVPYDTVNAGKYVKAIQIINLKPFGTSIYDTAYLKKNFATTTGNVLHLNTRNRTIKNELTFKEGDQLSPHSLNDSERLLRGEQFIRDARVFVLHENATGDSVVVGVLVKDTWSIEVRVDIRAVNEGSVIVNENNFLGLGHELENEIVVITGQRTGYVGRYKVNNFLGSYLNAELYYENRLNRQRFTHLANRTFVTPEIRNGGGWEYRWTKVDDVKISTEGRDSIFRVVEHKAGGWYGRSWPIKKTLTKEVRSNFILSFSNDYFHYTDRPPTDLDSTLRYQHHNLSLARIAFARRKYHKDYYVLGFGRTEDIPSGILLELTGGYDRGETKSRTYLSAVITLAQLYSKAGYVSANAGIGSFIYKDKFEESQGIVKIWYYSPLAAKFRRFKHRFYVGLNYIGLFRRINAGQISINNLGQISGVRGLDNTTVKVDAGSSIKLTYQLFTPFKVIGFRMAFFGITDLAYLKTNDHNLFDNRPYWGFGGGIRLNNENLIFGTINIGVAHYPHPPSGSNEYRLYVNINPSFRFGRFTSGKPQVLNY